MPDDVNNNVVPPPGAGAPPAAPPAGDPAAPPPAGAAAPAAPAEPEAPAPPAGGGALVPAVAGMPVPAAGGGVPPVGPPRMAALPAPHDPAREQIFTWLTVGQYTVLGAIGVIIVYYLFSGLLSGNTGNLLYSLSQPDVARGVITFLIAAATVSLAVLLVMAAIMTSGSAQLDQRFALGKEVLTVLVGVLGTIVGFYYGSAKDNVNPLKLSPVAVSESAPQVGHTFTLDALIIGGMPPYTYSIKFNPPGAVQDVSDQASTGPIHHEFTVLDSATPDKPVTFTIEVKDAKEQSFTFNKDGKQSITPKPKGATATASAATSATKSAGP